MAMPIHRIEAPDRPAAAAALMGERPSG